MSGYLINFCMAVVLASSLLGAVAAPSAAYAAGCINNRAVQALIATHKIKTWPAIKALAGISDQYKEVSAVRVCQEDDRLYYVVNVAGPSGESEQLVVNAVDGSK
ncbi:MAG TPA: hypothetical protein VL418_11635 [Devosiaceae bacterium]|nr:hypothetical protein [Devosiaceae bacterium]